MNEDKAELGMEVHPQHTNSIFVDLKLHSLVVKESPIELVSHLVRHSVVVVSKAKLPHKHLHLVVSDRFLVF